MSTKGTQIEFDVSEFETQVSDAQEDRIIEAIADSIERLRDQIDDNVLNEIFRAESGRYTMRSNFARDQLDPEPLTKNQFLNPLWTFFVTMILTTKPAGPQMNVRNMSTMQYFSEASAAGLRACQHN